MVQIEAQIVCNQSICLWPLLVSCCAMCVRLRNVCADAICAFRLCCLCGGKARLGEDHPQTLGSLNNLAMLLQAQGQLAEAEPLFREALKKSPGAQPQGLQKGLWAVDLESHLIGLSLGNLSSS